MQRRGVCPALAKRQHTQHNACMAPSITIRDISSATRDELAARAARSGRSLQEYLLAELAELAQRPDPSDVIARARERVRRTGTRVDIDVILAARDAERS
jgi:antitoxin FitA